MALLLSAYGCDTPVRYRDRVAYPPTACSYAVLSTDIPSAPMPYSILKHRMLLRACYALSGTALWRMLRSASCCFLSMQHACLSTRCSFVWLRCVSSIRAILAFKEVMRQFAAALRAFMDAVLLFADAVLCFQIPTHAYGCDAAVSACNAPICWCDAPINGCSACIYACRAPTQGYSPSHLLPPPSPLPSLRSPLSSLLSRLFSPSPSHTPLPSPSPRASKPRLFAPQQVQATKTIDDIASVPFAQPDLDLDEKAGRFFRALDDFDAVRFPADPRP
eukprot:3488087-Rhodomonas_salina.1